MKIKYLRMLHLFLVTVLDCIVYTLALLLLVEFYRYDFNYSLVFAELSKASIDAILNYYMTLLVGVSLFIGVLRFTLKYKELK